MEKTTARGSAALAGFSALHQPLFAVIWTATVLGNIGSFSRDVASSWVMTGLSASPTAVALVQTAATLPVFLLAIPAGVMSDIFDRRRFLIFAQLALAAVSATLLVLTRSDRMTVESLIALTFMAGMGSALTGPAWQAIVPELVPRRDLQGAISLNSLGVNIARAIGPAMGGALLGAFGAAAAYGVDVVSYLFVIAALVWWRRPSAVENGLSEQFIGAFRAGIRYARASRELHIVLFRLIAFLLFASALWALLPLIARTVLKGTSGLYGFLLAAVGVGAIAGAFVLPRLRQRLNADQLILLSSLIVAAVMACLASEPARWVAVLLLLALGAGWIIALTTLNNVVQSILPNWVRGRGLAVYLTAFNGAMAAGSLAWGLVAQYVGVPLTLVISAAALALTAIALNWLKLPSGQQDLAPSNRWAQPVATTSDDADRGPVVVQVEYLIRTADRPAFLHVMQGIANERKRDGAYAWGLTEHTADPERLMEWFLVESWAEHLRQHQRVSQADADIQSQALKLHSGPLPPKVDHFLAIPITR